MNTYAAFSWFLGKVRGLWGSQNWVTRNDERSPMIAFHGDPATKEKYIARVREHRKADRLFQGATWKDGKGCAVGCTLETYEHSRYPIELGVPEELAHLQDSIFEGLTPGDEQEFPEQFLEAIPVGADLSLVWNRFAVWLLVDAKHGVLTRVDDEVSRSAIQGVASLYLEVIEGRQVSHDAWEAAKSAACFVSRPAARSTGAACCAARSAGAACCAAGSAARHAALSARPARPAARYAARHAQRDELLRLLRAAPVASSKGGAL